MTGLLVAFVGIIFFYISNNLQKKIRHLDAIGKTVDGIIFSIDNTIDSVSNTAIFYPVVRFTTISEEWITARSSISAIPGTYKTGQSVKVIYEPEKPTNFYIKDRYSQNILKIFFIFSLLQIILGLYLFIFIEKS